MSAMEEYNQEGVEAIVSAGKPIPGQSLTTTNLQKTISNLQSRNRYLRIHNQ